MLPDVIKMFSQVADGNMDVVTDTQNNFDGLEQDAGEGFMITDKAFSIFVNEGNLEIDLLNIFKKLDREKFSNLAETGKAARQLILETEIPHKLAVKIKNAHYELCGEETNTAIAVSCITTAKGLPEIIMQGQRHCFLTIRTEEALVSAVQKCFASLFNDNAIYHRVLNGLSNIDIPITIKVQKMVQADFASFC